MTVLPKGLVNGENGCVEDLHAAGGLQAMEQEGVHGILKDITGQAADPPLISKSRSTEQAQDQR